MGHELDASTGTITVTMLIMIPGQDEIIRSTVVNNTVNKEAKLT